MAIYAIFGYYVVIIFEMTAMKTKLTTAKIEKLEPSEKQYLVWDEKFTGLGVLVSPKGTKTFVYQSRVGSKQKRITLGKYPLISLQDAIDQASEVSKQMVAGIDPKQAKAERLARNQRNELSKKQAKITFGQAFSHYFDLKKSDWSARYIKDHIEACRPYLSDGEYQNGCLANIWHEQLTNLSPEFIENWVREENKTRKTRMAQAYRMYKAFANWASERSEYKGLIPQNSATAKIVTSSIAKVGRDKYSLQRQQLKAWFAMLDGINHVHAKALVCMLINGSRPEEMLSLTWDKVDFEWDTITIIDKVDQWERTIPLTPYVKHLLQSLPRIGDYIFMTNRSHEHITISTGYRYAVRDAGLPPLPPKAMRKSFSNLSEWVSVPYGIVKQIMGHRPSATDEKHYKDRPIDLLRHWHTIIEYFILTEAGVDLIGIYNEPIDLSKYVIDAKI